MRRDPFARKSSGGVRPTPAPPEDLAARLAALIVEAQAIQVALVACSVGRAA